MTDEAKTDFNAKLKASKLYELAGALPEPKINLGEYTATDEASYNDALAKLKNVIQKRMEDEAQYNKDMDALKDKPEELQDEYKNIKEESRETLTVEDKKETPEPTPELSWVEAKIKFWKEYAEANALTADFTPPEEDKSPVYCKLLNGDKQEGVVSYNSPNDVQIAKESGLKIYQGLVKDAVENELSITFGKSLDNRQKLMLYAAVLTSDAKYKSGEKAQAVNPPHLSQKLMESDAYAQLPDDVKKILEPEFKKQIVQDKLEDVRGKLKQDEKDNKLSAEERYKLRQEQVALMEAQLSPEDFEKRKAKQDALVARKKEREGKE